MYSQNQPYSVPVQPVVEVTEQQVALHVSKVMAWMFSGLIVTIVASLVGLNSRLVMEFLYLTPYGIFVAIGIEFLLVIVLSRSINSSTGFVPTAIMFFLYSAVSGLTLSAIYIIYHLSSLLLCFGMTAVIFFSMAVYGYLTKRDLSKFRSVLFFGLLGIIAVSAINWFILRSSMLDMGISVVGIIVFVALIAFDIQKAKTRFVTLLYRGFDESSPEVRKLAIGDALELYLDFVNIFLYLLRLFGKRD